MLEAVSHDATPEKGRWRRMDLWASCCVCFYDQGRKPAILFDFLVGAAGQRSSYEEILIQNLMSCLDFVTVPCLILLCQSSHQFPQLCTACHAAKKLVPQQTAKPVLFRPERVVPE